MNEVKIKELIERGRNGLHGDRVERIEDYKTDQELKKPQPPLTKAPMREESISLPTNFESLDIVNDFLYIINHRSSHRVYTCEKMSLLELSYLLWCSQGVKEIRGKSYATLRTVPCGGARHEFECYFVAQNVEGIEDGLYHYLPMNHSIEFLKKMDDLKSFISESLEGQAWAAKANVVFYYSFVCYRAEWRYGIYAHRMVMTDAGHITENVYLALESIHMGGCAIGAIKEGVCNKAFDLDGEEEFMVYAMPCGKISSKDGQAEKDFYAFVKEQGL